LRWGPLQAVRVGHLEAPQPDCLPCAPAGHLYYGDHVHWATIITSTGALLSGLAIVIAFIQLGNQREDRLRAQVSKIGIWTDADDARIDPDDPGWEITLFIRNASELPVEVHGVELAVVTVGYPKPGSQAKRPWLTEIAGPASSVYYEPGTIPPGHKWHGMENCPQKGDFGEVLRPRTSIIRLAVTDAAGLHWDVRPYRGRPARRVRRPGWPWREMPTPGADMKLLSWRRATR
jgi:hypothetical protein